jgi:crotonobetaine/carnitine-CoA ligase
MIDSAPHGRALWRRRVEISGGSPFIVYEGRTRTFAEADEEVRALAAGLAGLGVGLGTRVLTGMQNRAETMLLHLALRELGAVNVPLMPGTGYDHLIYQAVHSEGEVLIADEPIAGELFPHRDEMPAVRELVAFEGEHPGATPWSQLATADPLAPDLDLPGFERRSPWAILYTSGSSGKPKGVVLPAGSFWSAGLGYAERFGVTEADNYFLPMTMAHAVGALTVQSMTLHKGGRVSIFDRFSPSNFWRQVVESGSTYSILFPAQLNLLLETEAGAPAAGETPFRLVGTHAWSEPFRRRFGVEVTLCWGMTETGANSTGTDPSYRGQLGEGYVGTPMKDVEVAVMDADGNHLPTGSEGEICLRHEDIMLEYLKDPENTAKTVIDGWVHSGDRGLVDEEDRLFFLGRFKNLIKRSGENVSAEAVEEALGEHAAVAESMVFGVPDRIRTEEVAAVVVVREAVDPAELSRLVAARIAKWHAPRYVVCTSEPLPRLGNGKFDRPSVVKAFSIEGAWDRESAPADR